MSVQNQPPANKFAFVHIAAKRARQLQTGAPPLLPNPRSSKPTRMAMEELSRGLLEYELPEKEEEE
ncbi:MAG: DNA-directed RNA polymerase subunit omega [Firmicutes bacterium]|nr:DNA-directed RNA polymerase subunit omega [Bacillota bacterium]